MTTPATVSVVLATHQGARFVDEQVASILAQTRPVDELVVVDDASRDDTVERVRRAAAHLGDRLVVVERPVALGVIKNFEDGVRRTTGDVVFFSDQDDVWHPEKVARYLDAFAAPGVLGVFGDAVEIDGEGREVGRTLWQATGLDDATLRRWDVDPLGIMLVGNRVTGASLAVRREALELLLPFPATGYHDAWIALLLTARGPGALVPLRDKLLSYRVHGTNASGGLTPLGNRQRVAWFVANHHRGENLELEQLPLALSRLQQSGTDTPRLERKLAFLRQRRALPATVRSRLPLLLRPSMLREYWVSGGKVAWLFDLLLYDAATQTYRPLPPRLDRWLSAAPRAGRRV